VQEYKRQPPQERENYLSVHKDAAERIKRILNQDQEEAPVVQSMAAAREDFMASVGICDPATT
jgi:hypothetical protein